MPNILIKVPQGSFTCEQRALLCDEITKVAVAVEQIGNDPRQRSLCWTLIEEVASGSWTCGAVDVSAQVTPCIVQVKVPEGVLNEAMRSDYVQRLHQAVSRSRAAGDERIIMSSIILDEVKDGFWAANGAICHLADFIQAAGYRHLQRQVQQ
ncbi:tautomerase family protein [Pseudomonas sp. 15FMM2]|uniref:Tautomerase family protein n=1 Tax=Pseudomonas imrae TaxID=2992837 RepID=A0ACC7PHT1_9PSED